MVHGERHVDPPYHHCMNLVEHKGGSLADCGEQPFHTSVEKPALMVDNGPSAVPQQQEALAAHHDARQLVRLVQCPHCSKPFTSPVTLPCGHTVCRTCLPSARPRTNISYPNTPDRQQGIMCPLTSCTAEHPTGECSVDVTLSKLMELIKIEMLKHRPMTEEAPLLLEEVVQWDEARPIEEKEKMHQGHQVTLYGGRLVSTFTMADMGYLRYSSDVVYHTVSGRDYQELDLALMNRLRDVAHKELDCLVCYNIMLDPTTTTCGHTFCRRCLARVMDHSNICPICRRRLNIPASLQNQPSNGPLVSLLNSLCPDFLNARAAALSIEEQPGEDALSTPLFICTLSFPSTPTFLHIFEPRYRLMMRRCVEGNRQFGMVMYNRSSAPQGELGATRFLEYGTMLEIVNFELLQDGRSFVECRGISRFRVRDHGFLDGYDVGRVEKVEDLSLADEERLEAEETIAAQAYVAELQSQNPQAPTPPEVALDLMPTRDLLFKCIEFIERMRAVSAPWLSARIVNVYGGPPNDPALFPYWFAAVLPIADEEKYLLLKTNRVRERLKMVNRWITRIEGQRWPSGNACNIL